jgi:hypothetical protein
MFKIQDVSLVAASLFRRLDVITLTDIRFFFFYIRVNGRCRDRTQELWNTKLSEIAQTVKGKVVPEL